MRRLVLTMLAVAAAAAQAGSVYRWVDKDGTVVFGDEPPPGSAAQEIEIPPANVIRGLPPRPATETPLSADSAPEEEAPDYRGLSIIYPEAESAVRQNAGNLSVRVELEPGLRPGDRLELLMDGSPIATSTTGQFDLTNVDRGTHTLTTRVVDEADQILIESEPVRFTMLRFSALFR